jgi:hypothetical protein
VEKLLHRGVIGIDRRSPAVAPFMHRIVAAGQNFDISRHTAWLKCQHLAIVNLVPAFLTRNRGWTKLTGVKVRLGIYCVHQQKLPEPPADFAVPAFGMVDCIKTIKRDYELYSAPPEMDLASGVA